MENVIIVSATIYQAGDSESASWRTQNDRAGLSVIGEEDSSLSLGMTEL